MEVSLNKEQLDAVKKLKEARLGFINAQTETYREAIQELEDKLIRLSEERKKCELEINEIEKAKLIA